MIGTAGDDTFTGTSTTFNAGNDSVLDVSTTDNDTYNLAVSAADVSAHKVSNVENINLTLTSVSAPTGGSGVAAGSYTGVKNLTITRADLTVGGSTIAGNKAIEVSGLDATAVAKVTAGAGTTTAVITQTKGGATLDLDAASGAAKGSVGISVIGSATINAANATGTVNVDLISGATTAEKAKALVINAAKADAIDVEAFTGPITVNAAAATTVTLAGVAGGATVNASAAKATIKTFGVDDSGVTINAGTGTKDDKIVVELDGKNSDTTAVATVAATGIVSLDLNKTNSSTSEVDILNLSGAAGDVTYEVTSTGSGTFTTLTATGTNKVNVTAIGADLTGTTITGVNTLKISTAGTGDIDLSKASAATIDLASALASSKSLKVADNAKVLVSVDQANGTTILAKADKQTLTVVAGDDTTSTAQATIDLGTTAFGDGTDNFASIAIQANDGRITASSTDFNGADVTISGTQNVTLGTIKAKSLTSTSTGVISLSMTELSKSVTLGAGADTVTMTKASTAGALTLDAGNGANDISVVDVAAGTLVSTGSGADKVKLQTTTTSATAIVVSTGAGNDIVYVGGASATVDTDAVIVMGDGEDKIVFDSNNAAVNLSDNVNFAMTGVEILDLTALDNTLTISTKQLAANPTLSLVGGGTADTFAVNKGTATGAVTIDLTGVTVASGSTVTITATGGDKADTITGGSSVELIDGGKGADTIDGGAGKDTFVFGTDVSGSTELEGTNTGDQTGIVVNLGATAITNTTILSALSAYTADDVTSVASGKSAYLYGAASTSTVINSNAQDTLLNIENITGSNGADYLVGDVNDNVITGGAGADYLKGGEGSDTFVFSASSNGSDKIADFTPGTGGDVFDFSAYLAGIDDVLGSAEATPTVTVVAAGATGALNVG